MTIHKGNIEAYLLDYLEGNLDALLTAELMAFLSENPEYEKWIPEYDGHLCLETGPVFEAKLTLKKDFKDVPLIDENNFEEFCIASGEGLLEEKDRSRLNEYLSLHPDKQRDFDLYGKLFLQPDPLLIYPDKKGLKKRGTAVIPLRFFYYAAGIAASIALLLLLVSRKPAEPVLTGKMPERVIEIEIPVGKEEGAQASFPVEEQRKKEQESEPAAITSQNNKSDYSLISYIEPIKTRGLSSKTAVPEIHRMDHPAETPVIYSEPVGMASSTEKTPIQLLGSVVKKLNLWKAAETAVNGFNYLTENRLSLVRTTDENGNFSSLSLESEENYISGNKVK
jgi:hypothetical protein